jgi:hypothetical protein
MPTLHLGVNDMPYATGGKTTGDVAEILEARYGVMAAFVVMREGAIGSAVEESLMGAIENMMMGGPVLGRGQALAGALSEIEALFKAALSAKAFDGVIGGVPTGASLKGVSHRFKKPYAKRGSRPSFIDTGLYQSSFRAWTD